MGGNDSRKQLPLAGIQFGKELHFLLRTWNRGTRL
jgi:hypothetical protein